MRAGAIIPALIFVISSGAGSAQSPRPRYSIAVSAEKATVRTGSELRLKIVQKNTTDKDQPFWIEGNPESHGEYLYLIDVRQSDGKEAPRSKYFRGVRDDAGNFRGGIALSGGLINVKPGAAITSSIDLNKLYDLKPGRYTVQVYQNDSIAHLTVKSNTITVTVTP